MNRIDQIFSECRKAGRKAMIVHVTAGDPDEETSYRILCETARAGADLIELGLPFSDPTADGPAVQRASQRALASGMTVRKALALVARFRRSHATPILLSSYANPLFRFGYAAFARAAAEAGADGLLAMDIPPEESIELEEEVAKNGMLLVRAIAPTTTGRRLSLVSRGAGGFFPVVVAPGCQKGRVERIAADFRSHLGLPLCLEGPVQDGELLHCISLFDGLVDATSAATMAESLRGDELVSSFGARLDALRGRL